jgi:hypothetical protein
MMDSNVLLAARRGNELAKQALDQSGYTTVRSPAMGAVALDVAEELFAEFSDEAGVACQACPQPFEIRADDLLDAEEFAAAVKEAA